MIVKTYKELKNALEKAGFVYVEENIDNGEFRSGKWICHNGVLEIVKSQRSKGIDIKLNNSSPLCTSIDIDLKIEPNTEDIAKKFEMA